MAETLTHFVERKLTEPDPQPEVLRGALADPSELLGREYADWLAQNPERLMLNKAGVSSIKPTSEEEITRGFGEGYTVSAVRIEEDLCTVQALCKTLRGATGDKPFFAAVHHTPPGSQAFDRHRDRGPTLALQVVGGKKWELKPAPSPGATEQAQEPILDVTVLPGDVIFVPSECEHGPRALPETESLHLNICFEKTHGNQAQAA